MGPGGPYGPPQSASGKAVAALVCAIASWVACGCFTSAPAVYLAWEELNAIKAGQSSPAGKGLATAALWVGGINLVLYVLFILLYVFMFVIIGVSSI